jgi:hypothetical protein
MTLDDIMAQERAALMSEYLFPEGVSGVAGANVPPYAAIPNFDVLKETPRYLRGRHPIRVVEISSAQRGQAFAQICPTLSYKFLWTHVDNNNYRADYISFLQEHYEMSILALPDTHHVDHLYSRERARQRKLPYVRMILLPRSINTSHGAGYEKSRTHGVGGAEGVQRSIDEIMLLKLWGISTPRKGMPITAEMQAHAVRMSALFGIPAAEIERNIHELMDVASFRPEP